jgi:Nickel/cobalt transporter regulator
MKRIVTLTAIFALALPVVAEAQTPPPHLPRPVVKPVRPPPPVVVHPVRPPAHVVVRPGPVVVPHGQFVYRGRPIARVHVAPFRYPRGFAYRRWAVGGVLPAIFLTQAYFYTDWGALGLPPPDPGFKWVRYGPDLLLVNVSTGQVADVIYGVFS